MGNAKSRLNGKIEDIYNENAKLKLSDDTKYITLEIGGDIGDATAFIPSFRYVFKN